jgi:uncharacterized membrane-anchored protein
MSDAHVARAGGVKAAAASRGLVDHPWRRALSDELHARPYEALSAPVRASHLAMLSSEETAVLDRAHVAELCRRYGALPPPEEARHTVLDAGAFRLKWERHTEFSTYTFFREADYADPFPAPPIELVPQDWLAGLPGQRLVAVHAALEPSAHKDRPIDELYRLFGTDNIAGSRMSGGAGEAYSDFRMGEDGFGRILMRDRSLKPRQAGRLVQRLLEIETYRMMALLALPLAREVGPKVTTIDHALAKIAAAIAGLESFEDERALLKQLTELSTRVEEISASTTYRFGAARAYYELVESRIDELRESRIEGLQTIKEFMDRRLAPAMSTCEATATRLEGAAARVSRAADLLSTRVDLELEGQNQELLQSMNRRAKQQLRLQQAVEGLSVTAISYYLVGLVGYVARAAAHFGAPINPEIVQGASIVPVVLLVALGVLHMRRAIGKLDRTGT